MVSLTRMRECERFFRSEWFAALSEINGEALIERLKSEHAAEQKRRDALFAPIR
jgi:hypothetical protein